MLPPRKKGNSPKGYSKFALMFGLLMTVLYISFGLFIIFAPAGSTGFNLQEDMRYVIGGILILYGTLRFFRIYHSSAKKKRNNYED